MFLRSNWVRSGYASRTTSSGRCRWVAVAVVEEHLVPDPHRPDEVAGLVVAHPIPVVGRVLRLHQVIKAEGGGLRFHQPVARTRHRRRIFSAAGRVNPCHATRVRLKYGYGHLTAGRPRADIQPPE